MREVNADLWDYIKPGAVICIPTNGEVTTKGKAVMGAGLALQARELFPGIDQRLGDALSHVQSNQCFKFSMGVTVGNGYEWTLVTFPTKNKWRAPSDIGLIHASAYQLVDMADWEQWPEIVLPRVGSGLGGLSWEYKVKPLLKSMLDDRFLVVG